MATTKAIWITDIHLNFLNDTAIRDFFRTIRQGTPDVMLVGGDIGHATSVVSYLRQMETELACPIYFVLGNHDYYHGSIASVRQMVDKFTNESRYLRWLNHTGVIHLSASTALVGHDSWGDGRLGDYHGSTVSLNDFLLIKELSGLTKDVLLGKLNRLGDEAAQHFRKVLPDALENHHQVIVLTHVPPFVEAAWYNDKPCGDEWLPFFACQAVGKVLKEAMEHSPNREMTVFCGHTHGNGVTDILPNLRVITGGAIYGKPGIQKTLEFE